MSRSMDSFSKSEINDMIAYYNSGMIHKEIAKIFDTSSTMISRIFKLNNVISRHPHLSLERKL